MPANADDPRLERQLKAWAESQGQTSPELRDKIRHRLSASLAAVDPLPGERTLVIRFLLVFVVCSAVLIALLDKSGFRLMTFAQMAGMAAILTGGGLLFSFVLARLMAPGSRQIMRLPAVLALSALGMTTGWALLFSWSTPWVTSRAFIAEGWPCAVLELMIAIPAIGIFRALARRGALFASTGLGAVIAGLAAFMALVPLQFQCMFPQALHLLVWHGGMAAILIVLGAAAGSWYQHTR